MSLEDFKAMKNNVKDIKDKFALPELPKDWSLVKVPKGTKMREGICSEIWQEGYKWGKGGGKQFEVIGWDKIKYQIRTPWFKTGGEL